MSSAHTPSNSHPDSSGHSPAPEPAASPETEVGYSQGRIRRAPSIPAFMILGLVVGLIVAFVSVWFGPGNPSYTFEAVFGVVAVIFGAVGTALGALLGLWLDRRSDKQARLGRAEPDDEKQHACAK